MNAAVYYTWRYVSHISDYTAHCDRAIPSCVLGTERSVITLSLLFWSQRNRSWLWQTRNCDEITGCEITLQTYYKRSQYSWINKVSSKKWMSKMQDVLLLSIRHFYFEKVNILLFLVHNLHNTIWTEWPLRRSRPTLNPLIEILGHCRLRKHLH